MKRTVLLRPEAEDDVEAAHEWYERQRAGLGNDFVSQLSLVLERIAESPEMYAIAWEGIRSGGSEGSLTSSTTAAMLALLRYLAYSMEAGIRPVGETVRSA